MRLTILGSGTIKDARADGQPRSVLDADVVVECASMRVVKDRDGNLRTITQGELDELIDLAEEIWREG